MQKKIHIFYHAHCLDGTAAKYAAWARYGNTADYHAVQYGKPPPEVPAGSEIYIVDFSYPKNVLEQLRSVHKRVIVLDHHKTAQSDLEGVEDCVFDMTKSGAVLSWEYFHKDVPIPKLLLHVQDRDLWKFEIPGTKEVNMYLPLLEGDMRQWDHAVHSVDRLEDMKKFGEILEQSNQLKIKSAIKGKIKVIQFRGYKVGITNTGELGSEIGNAIYESKELAVDFGVTYVITPEDEVLFSLRSKGEMDVGIVAKEFGGGGHRNAAGCKISLETLMKILKGEMSEPIRESAESTSSSKV